MHTSSRRLARSLGALTLAVIAAGVGLGSLPSYAAGPPSGPATPRDQPAQVRPGGNGDPYHR